MSTFYSMDVLLHKKVFQKWDHLFCQKVLVLWARASLRSEIIAFSKPLQCSSWQHCVSFLVHADTDTMQTKLSEEIDWTCCVCFFLQMLVSFENDRSFVLYSFALRVDTWKFSSCIWAKHYGASLITRTMISAAYVISKLWSLDEGDYFTSVFLLVGVYSYELYSYLKSSLM